MSTVPSVLRYRMGMWDEAEVEAGGVVGSHRPFVVGIPVVNESHPLYRIFCLVELFRISRHLWLSPLFTTISPTMFLPSLSTCRHLMYLSSLLCHGTVLLVCLALHPGGNMGGIVEMEKKCFSPVFWWFENWRFLLAAVPWMEAEKSGNKQAYYQYLFAFITFLLILLRVYNANPWFHQSRWCCAGFRCSRCFPACWAWSPVISCRGHIPWSGNHNHRWCCSIPLSGRWFARYPWIAESGRGMLLEPDIAEHDTLCPNLWWSTMAPYRWMYPRVPAASVARRWEKGRCTLKVPWRWVRVLLH